MLNQKSDDWERNKMKSEKKCINSKQRKVTIQILKKARNLGKNSKLKNFSRNDYFCMMHI